MDQRDPNRHPDHSAIALGFGGHLFQDSLCQDVLSRHPWDILQTGLTISVKTTMEKQPFNPFEFLTTPWAGLASGQGLPPGGAFNPTDIQDLDRRIQELKAVEQWLSLNLNLLKTTIQTMEVQRGTIAAIRSFTAGMAQPTSGAEASTGATPPDATAASTEAAAAAGQWWETMQGQFGQMMQAAQAGAESLAKPSPKPAKKPSAKKS